MDISKEEKEVKLIENEEENVKTDMENEKNDEKNGKKKQVAPTDDVLTVRSEGTQNLKTDNINALSPKKQREIIAKLHSKTETIGNFKSGEKISCLCCEKQIPRPYKWNKIFKSHELASYGIDLLNFNSIIKMMVKYLKYFWIVIITLSILSIIFNIDVFFSDIKNYFNNKMYDFFIFDFFFYSYISGSWIFIGLSSIFFGVILVFLFLKIVDKISLNKKKYRMNLLGNKEIEETLFSVFVKGLPKLTDPEDLKNFIETEYKVSIKNIIMLNDYAVLESLRKKLSEYKESGEFTHTHISSIKEEINKFAKNIERSGAAIVVFNDNEDRLLFFREFFNLKEVLYMYFKRHFIYRGKKIYFEPVPSIKMIDWINVRYSLEKVISNTKLQYVISFLGTTLLYTTTYCVIFLVSMIHFSDNSIINSLIKNILLLVLNAVLKYALILMINAFKLSDNYLKEIMRSYFIAQRNTNNTVFINLLLFASSEKENWSIVFLIILQNAKLAFLARYNGNYLYRQISYKLFLNKKVNTQESLNSILGENNFNFMTSYEGFKICFYLTVFVLIKSPTIGIIATAMLYLHLLAIRFSFTRSRVKDFNTNYYGFYFTYTMEKEFLNTGKFFLIYLAANLISNDNAVYIILFNGLVDFVFDIVNSKSFYTKFWVKKKYDEVEFTKKFEDEKFVNIELYMKEIDNILETIETAK